MFYLSLRSSVFNTANQISLLYSNLLDENNFELIYSRILENKHPIMLICLTEDKYGNILK